MSCIKKLMTYWFIRKSVFISNKEVFPCFKYDMFQKYLRWRASIFFKKDWRISDFLCKNINNSVFSPIQESTDQKKLRIWTLFTLCNICQLYYKGAILPIKVKYDLPQLLSKLVISVVKSDVLKSLFDEEYQIL